MRKVRIDKQNKKTKKGFLYLVKWTLIDDSKAGRQRYKEVSKCCRTMAEAEKYRHKKYQELNSDVYYDSVSVTLAQAKEEYIKFKEAYGTAKGTIAAIRGALGHLEKFVYLPPVDKITVEHLEEFVRCRKAKDSTLSIWTIHSELGTLRAFFNWCVKKKYHAGLQISLPKCPRIVFKCPTSEQLQGLFRACPCPAWRARLLILLCTALRAGDPNTLLVSDVDLKRKTIDTKSRKTGKSFENCPLPDAAIPELKKYIASLPDGQIKLFSDVNRRKTWEQIRIDAEMPEFTLKDLRKTTSTLLQKVGSLSSATQLLQHADSRTTKEFYSDSEIILRWKLNQLNPQIRQWLK